MTIKATIAAAFMLTAICASVAYTLDGWNAPIIATGQTALPLGIPEWAL